MGKIGRFLFGDEVDRSLKIVRVNFGIDLLRAVKSLPKSEYEKGRTGFLQKIRIMGWNNREAAVMAALPVLEEMITDKHQLTHIDSLIVRWASEKKISKPVFFEYMCVYQELKARVLL